MIFGNGLIKFSHLKFSKTLIVTCLIHIFFFGGVHFRVKRVKEGGNCAIPAVIQNTINVDRCYYDGEFTDCLLVGNTAPYVSQFSYTDLKGSSIRSIANNVYDTGGFVQEFELEGGT